MTTRTRPAAGLRGFWPLCLALPFLASGCALSQRHEARKIPQYGVVDLSQPRELQKTSLPAHVLEPPDQIEIETRPSLASLTVRSATVQPDGTIDMGFYGRHYVAGMSLDQVERLLSMNFAAIEAQRIQSSPAKADAKPAPVEPIQVSVRLMEGQESKRYYVLGTVTAPGSFPLTGNETVLDGVLRAGLKINSLPEKSYLVRPHHTGGPDQVLRIDWCGITQRGDTTTNYQLLPGDRVYVPGTRPPGLLTTLLGG